MLHVYPGYTAKSLADANFSEVSMLLAGIDAVAQWEAMFIPLADKKSKKPKLPKVIEYYYGDAPRGKAVSDQE